MPQGRDMSIYQSVVTTRRQLLDYVAFMLSDHPTEDILEQSMMNDRQSWSDGEAALGESMPIYEKLLRTASSNPKQIAEVQDFVKKMKPEIVPEELKRMLETFQKVSMRCR